MKPRVSHDRSEETPEAKARWFQSLTVEERMQVFCEMTELILQNNPEVVEKKNAQIPKGRVLFVTRGLGQIFLNGIRVADNQIMDGKVSDTDAYERPHERPKA